MEATMTATIKTMYYEPDQEEKELLASIEHDEWVSVENFEEEKTRLVAAAKMTSAKTRTINIRITERDLHRLKVKALQEGMPYQTLVTSILHKSL
jgi:predicted DNA binding CopG/RHH family protein